MAKAYVILGRQDQARVLLNKMVNEEYNSGDNLIFHEFYLTLAWLDVDHVAERLLELNKSYPSWDLMDYMAIFYSAWRDVLVHPDIQAYFVKEGKWIDYLAERVPEYEQYRK